MNSDVNVKAVNEGAAGAKSRFACPSCSSHVVRRIRRKGFWERYVLLRLGYYPWVCRECKHHFILRSRRDDTFGYIDDSR